MGNKGGPHKDEHSKTGEWVGEQQVNDILGIPSDSRDVHHHTVTDTSTGKTGTGSGWTRSDSERNANNDLKNQK